MKDKISDIIGGFMGIAFMIFVLLFGFKSCIVTTWSSSEEIK